MPRKRGQTKLQSLDSGLSELLNRAIAGEYKDSDAFNVFAGFRWALNQPPREFAENWGGQEGLRKFVGQALFQRLKKGDSRFFRELGLLLEQIPTGIVPDRDPALKELALLKLKNPGRTFTTAQIEKETGYRFSRRDIQRRAAIVGLKMDSRPGRRKS
jgi:hypothetical protein